MANKSINYSDGSTYYGEVNENGVPHGMGRRVWHGEWEGFSYEGRYKDGEFHGYGKYNYPDGGYYEGEYDMGKQTGKCVIFFGSGSPLNGALYKGDIVDGQWTGQGKITYADGTSYEGGYLNGEWHGFGKRCYTDGGYYEGEYDMGKEIGTCTIVYGYNSTLNGSVYQGEVENSKWTEGKITYADGSYYEGEFEDGFYSGDGYLSYPNGDFKDGSWHYSEQLKESHFTGEALLHLENGDVFAGEIDYDQLLFGTYTFANGDVYEGGFDEDGTASTEGTDPCTMKYADGSTYTGGWLGGKWNGEGTYTDKDGNEFYSPEWDDYFSSGKSTEEVVVTLVDGTKIVGKIEDGKFIPNN